MTRSSRQVDSASPRPTPATAPAPRRWRRLGFGVPAVLLGVIFAAGCNHAPPKEAAKPVEVYVTTPITDEVTDYQDFTGRLDALKTVEIRARVSGYVQQVPFKEGDLVHEGDLLFQIDPRSYSADYNQAVANHKQAVADRAVHEKNAERAKRLFGSGSIAQEEYDLMMGNLEKADATVGAMAAARDRAKLYLDYTRVTSPLTGRISRRFVDPGNLIKADDTLLTTIVTEDPMYAYFDVDERTYLDLVAATPSGSESESWLAGREYPVFMRLANEDEFSHPGTVNFVDNRLNGNTGTIRMRGVFPNPKRVLKSGLFVRIRLPIGAAYKATLIPDEAILSDQGRKYVYVVNAQNQAKYRPVELGQAIHGLRVIKPARKGKEAEEGLAPGDRVIVSGMQRVRRDATVQATLKDPPKPPSASGQRASGPAGQRGSRGAREQGSKGA